MLKKSLKIVFVTDVHHAKENVEKLKNWQKLHMVHFDLCLIGGDTAQCDQNGKTHDEQKQEMDADKILKQIHEIFSCPMYYIPGNHDPLNYKKPGHNISQSIKSVHQKTIQIAEGLQLIGFGGSVPGYLDKERTKEKWKGYPFDSNEQLSKEAQQKKVFESQNKHTQKIILTHCGPFDYQTSIDRRNLDEIIYGGAIYYNDFFKRDDLFMYLHGHVHHGSRFARVNEIPLINPGALLNGQFGYIFLERNEDTNKWEYKESHFVQLPSDVND